ncbi:MAG: metallophosphoesterase [Candidatus Thermoplasmatota archaeon]|nr:metallophosphoesterase [Candidatus Thermoplasmatota archaeon]
MERAKDEDELKECIHDVTRIMMKEPSLIEIKEKIMIAGDTHGDLVVTKAIVKQFFDKGFHYLVFLGDYIDRHPPDTDSSIPNMNYLIFLKREFPEKIILLKGNHETNYAMPCYPYTFREEVENVYPGMHENYVELFKNMPLMVLSNKIFAAHGGILKGFNLHALKNTDKNDIYAIESLVWSDPVISKNFRGAGFPYSREDLQKFLAGVNANVFIKGHDYTTLGMAIYGGICLTIFSSRRYKGMGNGGMLLAEIEGNVKSIDDIEVEDYSTGEWKKYDIRVI